MDDFEKMIEEFRLKIKNNPTTAQQGLNLVEPAAGQVHWPVNQDEPDLFFLITEVFDNYCEVIPGSFDAMMACTDDIILPENVFGNYAFLSLNLAGTLPREAIGKGFAKLDMETYNRIIDSQLEYETGEKGESSSFPFAALPYAHAADPRKLYHQSIANIIIEEQQKIVLADFETAEDDNEFDTVKLNRIPLEIFQNLSFQEEEMVVLAAGDETDNPFFECYVFNYNETVTVEHDIDGERLLIKCFTPDAEFSLAFDGWYVCSSSGKKLAIMEDGKAQVKNIEDFDGKLAFLDEFGIYYPLLIKRD